MEVLIFHGLYLAVCGFCPAFVENGSRINLGAYGGTEYASKTPSESERILLVLNVDGFVKGIYKLEWFPIGLNWQTGDTLKIEYSNNNGISWNLIAESALAEDGFYFWETTSLPDSPYYKIRITSNEDSNVYKESEDWFYVHNGPIHYYVNDDSNDLDEWCTGVGNDANNGLTPATPKASVQAILDVFDLETGDIIHIDTGNYYLADNLEITESDQGTEIAPVIVEGSPYGVSIDGNSEGSGSYIYLNESDFVTIRTATSGRYPGE